MGTLADLAVQGDVATVADESKLASIKLMSPQQLYQLWERQHWSAYAIDFSKDVADWAELPEDVRSDVVWGLSSFFVGEERVTTQFSGLVMAYEDQAEEAFLATQQVDEARHAQFFSRLYDEVAGIGGGMDTQLERVRADLNDAFIQLFDEHLVEAAEKLIANPRDVESKVDFVTLYHMVIEGTLALTGQQFITDFFEQRGIMPGFVEGFRKVSQDEHRHVAFGTWYLQKTVRERPELVARVQETLAETLPVAGGVLVPTGKDPFGEWDLLGYSSTEVNEFAFTALTRRLKVIGIGLPAVAA